jgi:hypothetical protein
VNPFFLRLAIPETQCGMAVLQFIAGLLCFLRIPGLIARFQRRKGRGWKLQPGVYAAAQLDILQPIHRKQSSLDPAQLAERHGESVLSWIAAELSHNIREAVAVPCRMDVAKRIISSQCYWASNGQRLAGYVGFASITQIYGGTECH